MNLMSQIENLDYLKYNPFVQRIQVFYNVSFKKSMNKKTY